MRTLTKESTNKTQKRRTNILKMLSKAFKSNFDTQLTLKVESGIVYSYKNK